MSKSPRNAILFFHPIEQYTRDAVASAAIEWQNAHFLRMTMLIASVVAAARAFFIPGAKRPE